MKRIRWSFLAAAAALGMLLFWAPQAGAGPGLYINLKNDLPTTARADVRLIAARGKNCWDDGSLWPPERSPVVATGGTSRLYTEKNSAFFSPCSDSRGGRGIDLQVREPGGQWVTPEGSPGDYKIGFNTNYRSSLSTFGFNFENGLTTWIPRADGRGLMCWNTYTWTSPISTSVSTGNANIDVLGDKRCNRSVAADTRPDPKRFRASPEPAQLSTASAPSRLPRAAATEEKGSPEIVNLLSTVGVACKWYAWPNNPGYCDALKVGDPTKWVLDNVPGSVKDFRITGDPPVLESKHPVATGKAVVRKGAGDGTVQVEAADERSTQSQTTTTHGASAGIEIGFEQTSSIEMAGIAKAGFTASQKISAGYNFSSAKTESRGKTTRNTVTITVPAKEGYETTLDVFTRRVSANYLYEADLTFGKAGGVTPVVTPATQALNMSPATRHPCLGYVVGDATVRNSIMNIGKALSDAGNKDTEPTLASERRAFLRGFPGFQAQKEECPGFPKGFASAVAFKGTGVGTYDSVGYDEEGQPRNELIGCVYRRELGSGAGPTGASSPSRRAAVDDPCTRVPSGGGGIKSNAKVLGRSGDRAGARKVPVRGAGVLIDARRAEETDGTSISDKVIGGDSDEEISAGSGTFDQVSAGGGDDLVRGGLGEDLIHGDEGDDVLQGGGGFDTVFGDDGSDRVLESGGSGSLQGNDDADTLIADGGDGLTLLGGPGDDKLISQGRGTRALGGGAGDDRYVLEGNGDDTVLEMPDRGIDVVATDRSFTVPADIEEAVATGDRPVNLRSGDGAQALTGNEAANELDAGIGSDRVDGAGGNDRILLDAYGFDRVTGGDGADDFIPLGTPANANRPASLERSPDRSAHLITDFRPDRGDRISMRAAVFGDSLSTRRGVVPVVSGREPRPRKRRGTILFDERTGVVSFDRDGTGPISDKVAVVLPDAKTLWRSWFVIRD